MSGAEHDSGSHQTDIVVDIADTIAAEIKTGCDLAGADGIGRIHSRHARSGHKVFLRHRFENGVDQHGLVFGIVKGFEDHIGFA